MDSISFSISLDSEQDITSATSSCLSLNESININERDNENHHRRGRMAGGNVGNVSTFKLYS